MNVKQWIEDLRTQIETLENDLPDHQAGRNRILPAQDVHLLPVIENQFNVKLPEAFVTLYETAVVWIYWMSTTGTSYFL